VVLAVTKATICLLDRGQGLLGQRCRRVGHLALHHFLRASSGPLGGVWRVVGRSARRSTAHRGATHSHSSPDPQLLGRPCDKRLRVSLFPLESLGFQDRAGLDVVRTSRRHSVGAVVEDPLDRVGAARTRRRPGLDVLTRYRDELA
jgi:hypothetical protein